MIRLTVCILCIGHIISVRSIDVQTTLGPIKGKLVKDAVTGVSYNSFEGIPYAEAPVGDLRFQAPVQKKTWTAVFDATKPGYVCPQLELYYSRKQMNEDCLIFNIYTPSDSMNKSLPVVFSIHGGDFNSQSGNAEPIYGPQFLVQRDLVVVSMNYRLGALGFLSFCSKEVSGNAGVKDVLLVLKIVHDNIKKFGGDPNNITLKGYGAGAAMAGLLMLTDDSKGLFQRVMLLSGSALNSRYIQLHPRENAAALVKELGLDSSNSEAMIKKLKLVDAFDIVKAQEAMSQKDPQRGFRDFKPFKPTVETQYGSAIITKPILKLIREGSLQDVAVMIGFNDQEGLEVFPLLKDDPNLIEKLNDNPELLLPDYVLGSAERKDLAVKIRDFYFGKGKIDSGKMQNLINMVTDSQYAFGIDSFVKLFKDKKTSPVYYYEYYGDSELNWFKAFYNITYPGAAHLDTIGYIYLTSITKSRYQTLKPATKVAQDGFLQYDVNFAYYGKPPQDLTKSWPEAGHNRSHIHMNNTVFVPVFSRPLPDRLGFWDKLYAEYVAAVPNEGPFFCSNDTVSTVQ